MDNSEKSMFIQVFGKEPDAPPPDATVSDAGKSKGESKGIVSILTMLKEDLEAEIANGVKAEVEAQTDFEKTMGKAQDALDKLKAKKTNTKQSLADTSQSSE